MTNEYNDLLQREIESFRNTYKDYACSLSMDSSIRNDLIENLDSCYEEFITGLHEVAGFEAVEHLGGVYDLYELDLSMISKLEHEQILALYDEYEEQTGEFIEDAITEDENLEEDER